MDDKKCQSCGVTRQNILRNTALLENDAANCGSGKANETKLRMLREQWGVSNAESGNASQPDECVQMTTDEIVALHTQKNEIFT